MGAFDSTNGNVMDGDSVKKPRPQAVQSTTAAAPQVAQNSQQIGTNQMATGALSSPEQMPKTVMIGGIPHQNINSTGGNPLAMAVDAYAQQAKFLVPSPFENRANERLAKNREGLGGEQSSSQEQKIAAPTTSNPSAAPVAAANVQQASSTNPLAENQFNHMVNNNLRSFEDKGGGIARQVGANGKVEFTNVGTANITDPSKQLPQANSIDMNASNASMARANAIRQEMINAQAPAVGQQQMVQAPVESQTDRENAEKTARWKMDELLSMAKRGGMSRSQTQLVNGLIAAQTQQRGQDLSHQNAIMQNQLGYSGQNVTMRGQDMAAQTAANHLAGNPLDNMIKSAQVEAANYGTEKLKLHNEALAKLNAETDPTKRRAMIESLLASQGKNPAEHRYIKVEGGEEIGPDGMTKIKQPPGMFDTQTQQFIPMTPQPVGANPVGSAPPEALAYLKANPAQAEAFKAKYGYLPEGL